MLKASGADLMFVQQPEHPDAMLYDIRQARWSDYRAMKDKPAVMMTSLLSGTEITAIMQALQAQKSRITLLPEGAGDKLIPARTYRVCFQPGLAGSLRVQQKNLPNISMMYINPYTEVRRAFNLGQD